MGLLVKRFFFDEERWIQSNAIGRDVKKKAKQAELKRYIKDYS